MERKMVFPERFLDRCFSLPLFSAHSLKAYRGLSSIVAGDFFLLPFLGR